MAEDNRLKKPEADNRTSHAASDLAVTQNVEISDAARVELLRGMYSQAILPDIPPIKGYHVCWLAANNSRDSIVQRMRLGYTPIRPEELPEFNFHETSVQRGTSFGDVITINEMMAFKLPETLYQLYMTEMHHKEPLRQEETLKQQVDRMREDAKAVESDLEEYDGMQMLRKSVKAPTFTG